MKEIRNPEKIEPPNRIGDELPQCKCPCLAMRQESDPRDFRRWIYGITADIFQFIGRAVRVLFRLLINPHPQNKPDKTESTDREKRPPPSPADINKRHQQRSQ